MPYSLVQLPAVICLSQLVELSLFDIVIILTFGMMILVTTTTLFLSSSLLFLFRRIFFGAWNSFWAYFVPSVSASSSPSTDLVVVSLPVELPVVVHLLF